MDKDVRQIAVVGAGIMGHGIAQICAQAGSKVTLIDSNVQVIGTARERIENSVAMLRRDGLLSTEKADHVIENLSFQTSLQEAGSADIVFEVVPEKIEFKQPLFEQLDNLCRSDAIFATNTSAIPISRLAKFSRLPQRVIGTHFYNPAQLIPLVEVITTDKTSPAVLDLMMNFLATAGKKPVHVKKDIPGFIGNRLQHAIAREAMSLVQKGVATAEEVDAVVKNSIALRMLFSGPLEQRDLNGLDTHIAITSTLFPDLEDAKEAPQLLREKVARGELGLKTGKGFYDWTDKNPAEVTRMKHEQLMSLLKFLQAAPGRCS